MSELNPNLIDLTRLPVGTHRFEYQLDNDFFAAVEKSEILGGQVSAKATLVLREEDYSLTIAVKGTVQVVCDRCLDPMDLDIDDEQEIFSEDEEETTVNLFWLAYEIVSINIPLVHCHPTGGCNPQMDLLLQQHLCDEPEPARSE